MKYTLFMFRLKNGKLTVTRGETQEQAKYYLTNVCGDVVIEDLLINFPHAAYSYSTNHPFNWCDNAPVWLNTNRKFEPNDFSFKERFRNSAQITIDNQKKNL